MRAVARNVLSLVVGLAGIAGLWMGLNQLLNTGSCTSGGPYVTTRTCPSDTIWWTLLLIGGFLAWLGGMFLSRAGLVRPGTGQLLWTIGFAGLGVAVVIKAAVQESVPVDARLGAYIIGGVFIPIGLAAGIGGLVQLFRAAQQGAAERESRQPDTPERVLRRLRTTAALTGEEFEQLHAAIDEPETLHRLAELQRLSDERAAGRIGEREFTDRKRAALAQ